MDRAAMIGELDELLVRVAGGDQDAFAAWYDATSAVVFGIVLRVLRDRAQAEEVTQEVYVESWQSARRFDPDRGSSVAWVNTIAHRRAVDRVRSAARSSQRDLRHAQQSMDSPDPDAADVVVLRDESRRVRSALAGLSAVQREVIELAYFQGRTQTEVARQLDIPLGTAKTRLRDALRHLRTMLGEGTAP